MTRYKKSLYEKIDDFLMYGTMVSLAIFGLSVVAGVAAIFMLIWDVQLEMVYYKLMATGLLGGLVLAGIFYTIYESR